LSLPRSPFLIEAVVCKAAACTDEQRREFGQLVDATVGQIESAQFLPRPRIRVPKHGCVSCAHLGLCLDNQPLVDSKLIRQPGASDLDWLDVLDESITEGLSWLRSLTGNVPSLCSRRSMRSWRGRRQLTEIGIRGLSNWAALCASFGQDCTEGWITCVRLMSSWRGSSRGPGARPTT
jgi:hypothetical protein